jgi:cold shock CspA family protein
MPEFGTVKLYKTGEGYGFIEAHDGGPDVFVHHSAIQMEGFCYLAPGERVIFEIEEAPDAPDPRPRRRATKVTEPPGRVAGTVTQFDARKGYGFIKTDDGERVFMHYTDIVGLGTRSAKPNERVTFFVEPGDGRCRKAVQIKQSDRRPELYRFAQFPPRAHWLPRLAHLAEHEDWSFERERTDDPHVLPILHSYITNTFAKLKEQADHGEHTIAKTQRQNRRWAYFDTGLVTAQGQHIYAVFEENRNPKLAPWMWRHFCTLSDRQLPCSSRDDLPGRARYFDAPRELTYDPRLELTLDYKHILDNHLHDRFPQALRTTPALARQALLDAEAHVKERAQRNDKIAVAQYWRGHIQLLLPLCLQHDADLALVVERDPHVNAYHANTVLPLAAAYSNARLLGRPDATWLKPKRHVCPEHER